jgi:hypothetical protein
MPDCTPYAPPNGIVMKKAGEVNDLRGPIEKN